MTSVTPNSAAPLQSSSTTTSVAGSATTSSSTVTTSPTSNTIANTTATTSSSASDSAVAGAAAQLSAAAATGVVEQVLFCTRKYRVYEPANGVEQITDSLQAVGHIAVHDIHFRVGDWVIAHVLVAGGSVTYGKRSARQRHRSPTPDTHRAARNRSASPAARSHPPRRRHPSPTHENDVSTSAVATAAFYDPAVAGVGGFSVPTTSAANLRLVAVQNALLQSLTTENQLLRDAATARDVREREHELRDRARDDEIARLRATMQTVSRAAGL